MPTGKCRTKASLISTDGVMETRNVLKGRFNRKGVGDGEKEGRDGREGRGGKRGVEGVGGGEKGGGLTEKKGKGRRGKRRERRRKKRRKIFMIPRSDRNK